MSSETRCKGFLEIEVGTANLLIKFLETLDALKNASENFGDTKDADYCKQKKKKKKDADN